MLVKGIRFKAERDNGEKIDQVVMFEGPPREFHDVAFKVLFEGLSRSFGSEGEGEFPARANEVS
jgi:hypothetical protein